jgi:hypothetical protein
LGLYTKAIGLPLNKTRQDGTTLLAEGTVTIVRKSCDARRTRAVGDQQDGTGSSLLQPARAYTRPLLSSA